MSVNLVDMALSAERPNAVIRTGVVVGPVDGGVVVQVGDAQISAGCLGSYAPVPGELVALGLQGASWLVLGSLAGTPDGTAQPVRRIQSGTVLVSFTALAQTTLAVPFPFPFASVPQVMTNIASGAGETARWGSRAISVNASQFTLFVFDGDNPTATETWADVPVQWIATANEVLT